MNAVTLEEISKGHILRVGDLKRIIEKYDMPDDAPVLIERVEDVYFDGRDVSGHHGVLEDGTTGPLPEGTRRDKWPVLLMESDISMHMREHNQKVDSGYYLDKKNYKVPPPRHDQHNSEEEINEFKDQFSPAHCATVIPDKPKEALYIRLHY